ncbi:MAG: beta-glucosidase [Acidobacteriaceae bacterium]|nr:beta-glucosidase [Acidobacteriaceae bacterium]
MVLDAAAANGVEVLLDLLHFGWPDFLDVFAENFVRSFEAFTYAIARYLRSRSDKIRMVAPVNEISFLSWAGGDKGCVNPYCNGRGHELKHQLIRAAARSSEVLLNELPGVRLISPEPVIHIVGNPEIPGDDVEAEKYRLAQYQAWDMLSGRLHPELGGKPEYLDILGANFYERNEWVHNTLKPLERSDSRYRPLHCILEEVWQRYRRPMFVSETGTEDGARAEWFNLICDEVLTAIDRGLPVHGICLYPILNHPGWEDDRHCYNGLFDYADEAGNRNVHWPLAHAIRKQQARLARFNQVTHESRQTRSPLPFSSSMEFRVPAAATFDDPFCA